jgi:hypothetical protein
MEQIYNDSLINPTNLKNCFFIPLLGIPRNKFVINGYKYPRIITLFRGVPTTFDLSLTNSKGLVETYEIKKLEHELISLSDFNDIGILQKIQGFRIY